MPVSALGQLITFGIEIDADQKYVNYIKVPVRVNDTIRKIVARRGDPSAVREVAKLNKITSGTKVLLHKPRRKGDRTTIRVPGTLRVADTFHVLAGEGAPTITGGYAKYDTLDRPERTGLTVFQGFDPITMTVPVMFDAFDDRSGVSIERDISLLERMAGRGNFGGAAVGDPPIVRVSTTNSVGRPIPLIPINYQWASSNQRAPLWRVAGIDWDENPIRNNAGNRIRQKATVTLQQSTKVTIVERSAAVRSKAKHKKKKKH